MADTLRDRTRRAVRAEISQAAVALFAERGFDETTVEEIARAVGMTKRSFFRYFPTKEDAVFAGTEVLVEQLIQSTPALRARLHQKRELWRRAARDVLVSRGGLDDFSADLLANAAAAVLDSVEREWVRTDGRADRAELLDRGFGALRPRLPA